MCGLEAYADAIVGTLGVEHKKRTTIGVELAAKVGSLYVPIRSVVINIFFSLNFFSSLMNPRPGWIRNQHGRL